MEIVSIEAIPVRVPLIPIEDGGIGPYVTNHGEHDSFDRVLVRVETDEGYEGWGEIRVFLSPETTVSIIEEGIAPLLLGQSPLEVESFRRQLFIEYTNVDLFFAPIEIACWDIKGQALGEPVYKLLGGSTGNSHAERHWRTEVAQAETESIEIAYCLGILSPEESAAKAEQVRDAGYSVLKTKAGRDWRTDVDRIVAMHRATDGDLEFRLDPNQGWTIDQALRVATQLEREGVQLQYLEQPIRVNSHESLRALRYRTTQPIAPNEDTYIPQNLQRMIAMGAIDVAVVDMTPAGGISGLRTQLAITEDAGIPTAHHCAFDLGIRTAAIAHTVSGLPGLELPSDSAYYGWADTILDEPLIITDGALEVPQEPGLGINVDMNKVATHSIN
jgi:L-alanine-DL-glutamate epimerase-like enolase superfamily enzyme